MFEYRQHETEKLAMWVIRYFVRKEDGGETKLQTSLKAMISWSPPSGLNFTTRAALSLSPPINSVARVWLPEPLPGSPWAITVAELQDRGAVVVIGEGFGATWSRKHRGRKTQWKWIQRSRRKTYYEDSVSTRTNHWANPALEAILEQVGVHYNLILPLPVWT